MAYIKGSKISVGYRKAVTKIAKESGEGKSRKREIYNELHYRKRNSRGIIR